MGYGDRGLFGSSSALGPRPVETVFAAAVERGVEASFTADQA
jgi:hypothetical protein